MITSSQFEDREGFTVVAEYEEGSVYDKTWTNLQAAISNTVEILNDPMLLSDNVTIYCKQGDQRWVLDVKITRPHKGE